MDIGSVEYLRELAEDHKDCAGLCCGWAADEIERLRAALREACDYAVSGDYPDILDAEDFMARLLEEAGSCKPQSD